jgi:ribonuclease HIII
LKNLSNKELQSAYLKAVDDKGSIAKDRKERMEKLEDEYNDSNTLIDVRIKEIETEINNRVKSSTMTIEEAKATYGEI